MAGGDDLMQTTRQALSDTLQEMFIEHLGTGCRQADVYWASGYWMSLGMFFIEHLDTGCRQADVY